MQKAEWILPHNMDYLNKLLSEGWKVVHSVAQNKKVQQHSGVTTEEKGIFIVLEKF